MKQLHKYLELVFLGKNSIKFVYVRTRKDELHCFRKSIPPQIYILNKALIVHFEANFFSMRYKIVLESIYADHCNR